MKWAAWTSMGLESEVWCGIGKYFTIEKLPLCTIFVMCQLPSYKILLWPLNLVHFIFHLIVCHWLLFVEGFTVILDMCVLWVGRRRAKHARGQRWLVDAGRWQLYKLENTWLSSCNSSLPLGVAPWLCTWYSLASSWYHTPPTSPLAFIVLLPSLSSSLIALASSIRCWG